MDNNYDNYNINNTAYEDGANDKEDDATYEDGSSTKATHEYSVRYPLTLSTKNLLYNYEQDTIDNNVVYETPVMGAAEGT